MECGVAGVGASAMFMRFRSTFTAKDAHRLLFGLILFELLLVAIYVGDSLLGSPISVIHMFDLDREATIPAWFSSVQLFLIGIIFLLVARQVGRSHHPSQLFLVIVGSGFIFLSADEAAAIHEKITLVLKDVPWVPRFKGEHGIWIPIYFVICLVLLLMTYPELKAMWTRFRRETLIMAAGLTVFLLGVVGLEIASYEFLREDMSSMLYRAAVALEELLEMSGASLVLYGAVLLALRE